MQKTKIILVILFCINFIQVHSFADEDLLRKNAKTIGEYGGTKTEIIEFIGLPKFQKELVGLNDEDSVTGPKPNGCRIVKAGDQISIWSYPLEKMGFYQLIFHGEVMTCIRWKPGDEPFGGITDP